MILELEMLVGMKPHTPVVVLPASHLHASRASFLQCPNPKASYPEFGALCTTD